MLNLGQNHQFFGPSDLEICQMTLIYNILCYSKLCISFHSHQWIQIGVTAWKCQVWVQIGNFLSCVTLKFDGWPWKTVGHLFYATLSYMLHFIAISEFKLELQSGNTQFRSKSVMFLSLVTLKFAGWLRKAIGHLSVWHFKLYASFLSHVWIQSGVTVRKRLNHLCQW